MPTSTYSLLLEMTNHPEIERQMLITITYKEAGLDEMYAQQSSLHNSITRRDWERAESGDKAARERVRASLKQSPFAKLLMTVVRQAAQGKVAERREDRGFFAYYYGRRFVLECDQLNKALNKIMAE